MTSESTLFPRVNLVKERVSVLAFRFMLGPEVKEKGLDALTSLLRDGEFLSLTPYSREKVPHMLVENVATNDEHSTLYVHVMYDASPGVPRSRVPAAHNRRGVLLGVLSTIPGMRLLECHVDFTLAREANEPSGLWISLPIPVAPPRGNEDSPVTELRGIRGVKLAPGEGDERGAPEYSFILDRPENEDIFLSLDFRLETALNGQTPIKVLARAREIAIALGSF